MDGTSVTYDIDYLLDNLAREIYLLESYRKWRKEKDNEVLQPKQDTKD